MEKLSIPTDPEFPEGRSPSSSSSSASSSSSTSSDSSDSDSNDTTPGCTLDKKKDEQNAAPRNSTVWSSTSNRPLNVVACGSFSNESTIVPIKCKVKKLKRAKKRVLTLGELERRKKDPCFKIKSKNNAPVEGSSSSDQPCCSKSLEPSASSTRLLRTRTQTPILNEKYIFQLQHEKFKQEIDYRRKKNKRGGKINEEKESKDDGFDTSDTPPSFLRISGRTADWDEFLKGPGNSAFVAPVNLFNHASFSGIWQNFARVGVRVEIPNVYVSCDRPVYWVATIRFFAGYKALVQYETFGSTQPYCAWMSYASDVPKPIGYCDKNRILLFPPDEVYELNKDFLIKIRAILGQEGIETIPADHVETVTKGVLAVRKFKIMEVIEVMDNEEPSQNMLAHVTGIVGDRIHVSYTRKAPGYWFNCNSVGVHKVGWSYSVGVKLVGVPNGTEFVKLEADDFPPCPPGIKIEEEQVFEAIHPFDLNRIVAGYVSKVYNYGYFMAKFECNPPLSDLSFCFHITSPWILPVGFAHRHGIPLGVPRGEKESVFDWNNYLTKKHVSPLDLSLVPVKPPHKWCVGAKMEAIDLRQPTFCGPATIIKIAEHLILIHFDGWNRDNTRALQWMDARSCDIYPAGWAEMVGHDFQSNPSNPLPQDGNVSIKKFLEAGSSDDLKSD